MAAAPPFEDPRRVLDRHGLRPKRSFSQNFLVARPIVERIADLVAARRSSPEAPVIELGPGVGTLTAALLRRGLRVIAVERDRDMIGLLELELGGVEELTIVAGDAATIALAKLPVAAGAPPSVVGNLPYAITGAILRNLMDQAEAFANAVVMVQREVRDRLLSPPGLKTYGALTVFARAHFDVEGLLPVPKGAFHPAPRVDSAVVELRPHGRMAAAPRDLLTRTVRAAFEQRRKMLRNALLQGGFSSDAVGRALVDAGIDGMRRGETLSLEDFEQLAAALLAASK